MGSSYTLWNGRIEEGFIFKRLDRVLVNQEFLNVLPSSITHYLIRQRFDQALLHVICNFREGPVKKPFKFLNFWNKNPRFMEVMKENWSMDFFGDPFVIYKAKLKKIKLALANWSRATFGKNCKKLRFSWKGTITGRRSSDSKKLVWSSLVMGIGIPSSFIPMLQEEERSWIFLSYIQLKEISQILLRILVRKQFLTLQSSLRMRKGKEITFPWISSLNWLQKVRMRYLLIFLQKRR